MLGVSPGAVGLVGGAADGAIAPAPMDPDAAAYFGATGISNPADQAPYLALFAGLKADGLWSLIDMLYVYAAPTTVAALTDLRVPSRTGTAVASPTFTAWRGYTFNGTTQYVTTGFEPANDGVAMTGTSFGLGVYERTDVGATTRAAGAASSATAVMYLTPRSGTNMFSAALNAAVVGLGAVADSRGFTWVETDGTNGRAVKNGTPGTPAALTTPGTLLTDREIWVGGYNNAGVLAQPRAAQEALCVAGAKMDNTQAAALYTRVQAFMTAVGANV